MNAEEFKESVETDFDHIEPSFFERDGRLKVLGDGTKAGREELTELQKHVTRNLRGYGNIGVYRADIVQESVTFLVEDR